MSEVEVCLRVNGVSRNQLVNPGEIRERMSGNLCRCGAYASADTTEDVAADQGWARHSFGAHFAEVRAAGRRIRDLPITPAKLLE